MKKIFGFVFVLVLMLSVSVSAAGEATVYVTVSDGNGVLSLNAERVTVTDINNDGILTIDEALKCTHEQFFDGGAEAGYSSYVGQYGIALDKLWGVSNGGSYGYYLNNASAMSMSDAVKDGDYLVAYAYSDLTTWSDVYSFFEEHHVTVESGESLTLKLMSSGFDENFAPLVLPVKGAVITFDGEKTEYVTDENGSVTVKLSAGEHIISAVSEKEVLVPPACVVTVNAKTYEDAPQTADSSFGIFTVIMAVTFAATIACFKKKYINEK